MVLHLTNDEHSCICKLIMQGVLMCCDSALEGTCQCCKSSVLVTAAAQTTLFRGFTLPERAVPYDGQWSAQVAERRIRNCDTAFAMFMRPVPASETGWPETSVAKAGCDAWKTYAKVGVNVQRAFTDTFRRLAGFEPVEPDPTVLSGVSTTVLANARMVSPFCSCIFESHVNNAATGITEARQKYVAAVHKMSHGDAAGAIDKLQANNDKVTDKLAERDAELRVAVETLASERVAHAEVVAAMRREVAELKEQVKEQVKQAGTSALAEQFRAGLAGVASDAMRKREADAQLVNEKRKAAAIAKAAGADGGVDSLEAAKGVQQVCLTASRVILSLHGSYVYATECALSLRRAWASQSPARLWELSQGAARGHSRRSPRSRWAHQQTREAAMSRAQLWAMLRCDWQYTGLL